MEEVALRIRGLTRRFGRNVAVDGLDLTVRPGDVYGFLGPNGAGKTTAIRCALGLIGRDAGDVAIFGDSNLRRGRRQVGAIVETPAFHAWMSGRANLLQATDYMGWSRRRAAPELDRVLERVGLSERSRDRAGTYSLGMRQRLGIARALLGGPRLLVPDEPTNGLDPRGMREIRDLLRALAHHDGITVFISSHLLAEVQSVCNRVGILQQGRLRAEGEVAELLGSGSSNVVEIGSSDPDALRTALADTADVEVIGAGSSGRVRVRHQVPLASVNRALVRAGVPVDSLVPQQRSLEDVFLEVTG